MKSEALTQQQLGAYLARIGFDGVARPGLATLHAILRAHVQAIAFENIDVQLGRTLDTDVTAAFLKLVEARRGGWCYEHNGVLGAALAAIGFDVMRVSAAVMRQVRGDQTMGSHMCLLVQCERAWLVDAGFGSLLSAPVPLEQGPWMQQPLPVSLGSTDDGFWRLSVARGETTRSYDFRAEAADEEQLSAMCNWQCRDPASVFVQNLSVERREAGRHVALRGKVLSEFGAQGEVRRVLASESELVEVLREAFLLDVPQVASLWPVICERHDELFGPQAAPTT